MKLIAFCVKNYRSIVNSNFNKLSPDNITALIGQNESGKTSVLEALQSFYEGIITDDILRSDLSLPQVSCEFDVDEQIISKVIKSFETPDEVADHLRKSGKVLLTRSWNEAKQSNLELGGEIITSFYTSQKEQLELSQKELMQNIMRFDEEGTKIEKALSDANQELLRAQQNCQKAEQQLSETIKSAQKAKSQEQIDLYQNQTDKLQIAVESARGEIKQKESVIEELNNGLTQISTKVKYARLVKDSLSKSEIAHRKLESLTQFIRETEESLGKVANSRDVKNTQQKLDTARGQLTQVIEELDKLAEEVKYNKAMASFIFQDIDHEDARKMSIKQLAAGDKYASSEDLANEFFKYCPTFELFEDFSSLLPNRIDLDDLLNENSSVEGYKAARNFLVVAGIDADFFDQQNSRILKQKIENLNGELTVNFQDFWRQNVGKNNKIKINFELDHYDYSHPDKKGKPYLEFWIKDTRERLYPKQRSRGVRWFLSFYLELKASAKLNHKNRILLIDEPGVSLHARAQEDVLKVFEDIKENLNIIYTTHSPHLVDVNKLYRILAVQRAIEDDDNSESVIYDVRSLSKASADTLSPLYSLMGVRFTDQQFIHKDNNLIVEDNCTYYFLSALFKLVYPDKKIYILPATDVTNVPTLANLLLGWKLDFVTLLSGTPKGRQVFREMRSRLFADNENESDRNVIRMEHDRTLIDYFSTIDFKNLILHQRVGITESNSEYVENNGLSCSMLSMDFMNNVIDNKIKLSDFDDETRTNLQTLLQKIIDRLH
ncbi:MAG TPA: AAA family ATPase [Bacteroidales bacterium]